MGLFQLLFPLQKLSLQFPILWMLKSLSDTSNVFGGKNSNSIILVFKSNSL